jgi:hypothetical protein
MFQLVRHYEPIADSAGVIYQPRAYGDLQPDGSWDGWLVFFPILAGKVIATDCETTQHSLTSLARWASTVTPVYLEGALDRAQRIDREPTFSARLAELSLLDRRAAEDVASLEAAAERARIDAVAAADEAAAHETAAAASRAEARERSEAARVLETELAEINKDRLKRLDDPTTETEPRAHAADRRRAARRRSSKPKRPR